MFATGVARAATAEVAGVEEFGVAENGPAPSLLESLELLELLEDDEAVVGRTGGGAVVGETPTAGAGIGEDWTRLGV